MGYRSNVAYLILFPSNAEYHSFLSEVRVLSGQRIQGEGFDNFNGHGTWGDMVSALDDTVHGVGLFDQRYLTLDNPHLKFPAIAFKVKDVKWYPSYPEVHSHESLLHLAKMRIHPERKGVYLTGKNQTTLMTRCAVNFLRIGEESHDVEHYETGDHVALFAPPIWTHRSIAMSDAMEKLFDKEDV